MRLFAAITLSLIMQAAFAGELYRWVDSAGKVHYSDVPVEEADKVDLRKFGSPASGVDDASLPYETRVAKQKFPVTFYASESCGEPCKRARDFLNKRHVPYSETILKTDEDLVAFQKKSGSSSSPTISIGRNWLIGFQPGQWESELDAAGYPK